MWAGIELISDNLLIELPHLLLFIASIGCMIMMAKDFKLGLMMEFFFSGVIFMYLYSSGQNWIPALSVMMLALVLMAFSLYFTSKTSSRSIT